MQSYDLEAVIREHAERIDSAVPHVTIDDVVATGTDPNVGMRKRRRAMTVPGYVVAVAAAVMTLLGVGGMLLALDLIGPNHEEGSLQVRAETSVPSTSPAEVSTIAPAVVTTIAGGTAPEVALPLQWTRYETEAALDVVGGGGGVIIAGGREYFVDEAGYRTAAYRLWRSTDGSTMTKVAGPNLDMGEGIRDIAYGDGRYVVINRGLIVHSEDGATWTYSQHIDDVWVRGASTWSDQPGSTPGYLTAITYGNDRFIAVGGIFEFPSSDADDDHLREKPAAWISVDANTWTRSPGIPPADGSAGAGEVQINDVTFDGESFIAVGLVQNDRPAFWRSVDGVSWSLDMPDSGGTASSVAASGDAYVAVGSDGYWYSKDSATWVWFDRYVGNAIVHGDGVFVAVGWTSTWDDAHTSIVAANAVIQYSIDGVEWTPAVTDPEALSRSDSCGGQFAVSPVSVAYLDGRFVAVGHDREFGAWPEPWPCPTSDPVGYVWIGEQLGP